nr:MAG TPA: hypothetical protein [Caudoviricetes sp.]
MVTTFSSVLFCSMPLFISLLIGLWCLLCKPNDKDKELMQVDMYNLGYTYPTSRIRCMSKKEKVEHAVMVATIGALLSVVSSLVVFDKLLIVVFSILSVCLLLWLPLTDFVLGIVKIIKNEIARRK